MARVSDWLLLFLVNAAWQVGFVALLAAAIDRMLRVATARYRHLLWVAALMVALALPLATTLRLQPPAQTPKPQVTAASAGSKDDVVAPEAAVEHRQSKSITAPARGFKIPSLALGRTTAVAVCALYGLLLLFRLAALTAAWRRTRSILREASEIEPPPSIAVALARCRAVLRIRDVRVLASSVTVPLTLGALRPAVILPGRLLQEADPEIVTSALGHELAHIARHDYVFNVAYELLSLPLWFHPAMALVLRRIRETREVRCDEIVTDRLQDARVYAQSLVELAGAALPFGRAAATITVGIADADILEERVKTLLNRPRLKQQTILVAAAAVMFAVPCMAAARLALRVHVQSAAAVSALPAQQAQPDSRQELLSGHRVGDMVTGRVVKKTNTRAVIELAPGVYSIMRIPTSSSTPYDVGSEHQFQISRLNPEEKSIGLLDPTGTYVSGGGVEVGVAGGVPSGVVGGVRSSVVGGVDGEPRTMGMLAADGEPVLMAAPKMGFALAGQEQGADTPVVRKKLELAERKRAEEALLGERQEEPRTPEQQAKLLALLKQRRAAESKELLQTAREAKITMEQAISIAQTQQPGTVFESRPERERGVATYIVGIVSGDENNSTRTRYLINATDGKVMDKWETRQAASNE